MNESPMRNRPSRQSGTSLVEVLVTLVILSIGLLGLAGLQLSSTQGTNSAAQRFEATLLAQEILERMRANRLQALNHAYDIGIGEAVGGGSELADADLAAWKAALAAALPNGDGSVELDANDRVTITVQWSDAQTLHSDGEDPPTGRVQLRSEL